MAARWSVDADGTLRRAWPIPGEESRVRAYGWVAANETTGVIEGCDRAVDSALLEMLDAAFPGRRWFEAGPEPEAESLPMAA